MSRIPSFIVLATSSAVAAAPTPPADLGRRVYEGACATCHGEKGDGRGPSARVLDPRPRDFTGGAFKFRSTPTGAPPTVDDVLRTIRQGIPGTTMAAWGDLLGDEELRSVAEYVLAFAPKTEEPPPSPLVVPPLVPFSLQSFLRGRELYKVAGCVLCHGKGGKGDGPSGKKLKDDAGWPIKPGDLTRDAYKGGWLPIDVYRTFVTGMNGTPMPSFGDALPGEEDRWALVHYVRTLRHRVSIWRYLFGSEAAWQ